MRILITKQGNIIIQEIDDAMPLYTQNINSTNKIRGYSTNYQIKKLKNLDSYFNNSKLSRTNNLIRQNSTGSSIQKSYFRKKYKNLEDSEITKEELKAAKQIKLNEHKITFPKQFAEKYERDVLNNNIITSSNNILPSLNSKRIETQEGLNNSLIRKEKFLSLGEIIPNNSLTKMKKKILKDRLIRDRDTVITENDFRSLYEPETDIQKFNNILVVSN